MNKLKLIEESYLVSTLNKKFNVKTPNTIPVFPLSGALLLPSGNLPLNIFEPRYIAMINYALRHDKLVGMIQPKKENSDKLFETGCVGKITTYNETEDNRYIINLFGISKFHIKKEVRHSEKFRIFDIAKRQRCSSNLAGVFDF